MLHSIYDLTTFCRRTTGDVPAKLVGASTTVVGSKLYLFGGRLVTERRMVSDLYEFDLETFEWVRVPASTDDDVPRARYFHSADAWNNHLVIFGGMTNQLDSSNPDELCVLNDVRFFDLATRRWLPAELPSMPSSEDDIPRARYAHLSSITSDQLFIIGGQDFFNTWLDDVCVYDLKMKAWVRRRDYPRHCGTYRSVAVSSNMSVCSPPQDTAPSSPTTAKPNPPSFRLGAGQSQVPPSDITSTDKLIHLPYSAPPSEDQPGDIFLYSNYNFTDVKRELEVFSPLPDHDFTIQDRSTAMSGSQYPPGLRFPTGAILGTHLIIAGTYLAHSYQSYSIWVLDLQTMAWSRIDPGKAVETGSWFRGCLWAEGNKFFIFGNRNGNLVDDYNRRLLSWDHVAVVDLEAFGIYQPPELKLDIRMQELGLAALEERVLADFDIICDDGRKIPCSRKVLEERWPWFRDRRKLFLRKALSTLETLPSSSMHTPLPEIPGTVSEEDPRMDPRLTPRSFQLSEPYPITLALLQYFYSMALITPLQHAPAVLSQLLVLATNYRILHLESLVKHAMHRALSNSTSVGVYEVATLCSCRSLQIRALKTVMSYTQKRPTRSRGDKEGGGNSRPPDGSGHGGSTGNNGTGGGHGDSKLISRPRGTSDARWHTAGESGANGSGYNSRNLAPSASTPDLRNPTLSRFPLIVTDGSAFDGLDASNPTYSTFYHANDAIPDTPWRSALHPSLSRPLPQRQNSQNLLTESSNVAKFPRDLHLDLDPHAPIERLAPSSSSPIVSFHLPRPRLWSLDTATEYVEPPSLTPSSSYSSLGSGSHDHFTPLTPNVPPTSINLTNESHSEDENSMENSTLHGDDSRMGDGASEITLAPHSRQWPSKPPDVHWTVSDNQASSFLDHDPIEPTSGPSTNSSSFTRFISRTLKDRQHGKSDKESSKMWGSHLSIETRTLDEDKKRQKKEAKASKDRAEAELQPNIRMHKQGVLLGVTRMMI